MEFGQSPGMTKVLIDEHKTACTGYAWLLRELCRHAGITCEIVDGYSKRVGSKQGRGELPDHSWNAVLLDGEWYLCDPTWSAGAVDTNNRIFVFRFEERYFLADPNVFKRNHSPLVKNWSLIR
jgi:transglutaminase/protease-like cytokinesis protein 3